MSDARRPLQVGDEIPTMVFDEDDNLVGAVMAVVVRAPPTARTIGSVP